MIAREISNVVLSKRALETIVKAAKEGYLKPYKQERLGILLGRLKKDTIFVSNAFLQRGGKYTRTSAMVLESQIDRHIKQMVSRYHLRFLGSFHTHNEVAKTTSSALSKDDRNPIEMLVQLLTKYPALQTEEKAVVNVPLSREEFERLFEEASKEKVGYKNVQEVLIAPLFKILKSSQQLPHSQK